MNITSVIYTGLGKKYYLYVVKIIEMKTCFFCLTQQKEKRNSYNKKI